MDSDADLLALAAALGGGAARKPRKPRKSKATGRPRHVLTAAERARGQRKGLAAAAEKRAREAAFIQGFAQGAEAVKGGIANVRRLPQKERKLAAKRNLYGNASMKNLMGAQRSIPSKSITNQRLSPEVAVIAYNLAKKAAGKKGIKDVTSCLAGLHAGRRARRAGANRKTSNWQRFVKDNYDSVRNLPSNQRFSALAQMYNA